VKEKEKKFLTILGELKTVLRYERPTAWRFLTMMVLRRCEGLSNRNRNPNPATSNT